MELSHLLLIVMTTSASAKFLIEKQSANHIQKTRKFVSLKEEVLQTDVYNKISEEEDSFMKFYDDILCSFAGEYPDTELQMPNDIIAIVDDLKSNFEFALSDMTSSIGDHIEVLQETIEYVVDDAIKVLDEVILNFARETTHETLAEADNDEAGSLKHITEHLSDAINEEKLNLTRNISQTTELVAKYVFEATSSIFQETDRIIEAFFSVNDKISDTNLELEQALDTLKHNLNKEVQTTQENIKVVFSYIKDAVEVGNNLLSTYLDNLVLDVSKRISSLKISRDKNEITYNFNYTLHDQITSLHGILTEAVSTALFAIFETVFNFATAIQEEIQVAAESLKHSSLDFEKLYFNYEYMSDV